MEQSVTWESTAREAAPRVAFPGEAGIAQQHIQAIFRCPSGDRHPAHSRSGLAGAVGTLAWKTLPGSLDHTAPPRLDHTALVAMPRAKAQRVKLAPHKGCDAETEENSL